MMSTPTLSNGPATGIGVSGTCTGRLGRVAQIRQGRLCTIGDVSAHPIPPIKVTQLTGLSSLRDVHQMLQRELP